MSAESLAPPVYVIKDRGIEVIVWGSLSKDEKDYYIRILNNKTTTQDDFEDQHLLQLRRFEYWKKDSGLDE